MRTIRSYVLHQGRMTKGQRLAFDTLSEQFGLAVSQNEIDTAHIFGRSAETVIEVGFGDGEALIKQASEHDDVNFIGVEVFRPGVGHLLQQLHALGLRNVRTINHDAVDVLKVMIPDESCAGINVFFPDPWHKKRHHKRRLVQQSFINLCFRKLKVGGIFHFASDWQEYAEQVESLMIQHRGFESVLVQKRHDIRQRPLTKFERRGLKRGYHISDIVFEKIQSSESVDLI